jgi:hypothetical protein
MHQATMSQVEINRYYVILRAYDFQTAWKEKKLKLLWETRFSLGQRLHDFGKNLPTMAQSASIYFGHDSYGLIYRPVPEGRVEVGEATVLEDSVSSGDVSGIAGDWRGRSPAVSQILVHFDKGGASTVGYPKEHWSDPATVTVAGGDITIWVPGRGLSFHGKIKEKEIAGTMAQYGYGSPMTLFRVSAAAALGLPINPEPGPRAQSKPARPLSAAGAACTYPYHGRDRFLTYLPARHIVTPISVRRNPN